MLRVVDKYLAVQEGDAGVWRGHNALETFLRDASPVIAQANGQEVGRGQAQRAIVHCPALMPQQQQINMWRLLLVGSPAPGDGELAQGGESAQASDMGYSTHSVLLTLTAIKLWFRLLKVAAECKMQRESECVQYEFARKHDKASASQAGSCVIPREACGDDGHAQRSQQLQGFCEKKLLRWVIACTGDLTSRQL